MKTSPIDKAIVKVFASRPAGMTREELEAATEMGGVNVETLRNRVRLLCRPGPKQQIHIARWEFNPGIQSFQDRPVYVVGPGPNAEPPPRPKLTSWQRHQQRTWMAKRRTHNFVFNLGLQ